jgi:signal transduction histidine kinase
MSIALPLDAGRPPDARRWPKLLVLYGMIFPPAVVLTSAAFWPMWHHRPLLALGNEVLSLALLASGILLLDEPAQQSPALMLIGSSALLTAGWIDNWHVGPLPLISVPASPLGIVLAGWAMFRYPNSPSEMRVGTRFFIFLIGWLLIGETICIVVSRPQWNGFAGTAWWPALLPDKPLFTAAASITDAVGILFAVVYMLLWIRRRKHSRGISRRLATPITVAASFTCASTIVELAAVGMSASSATMELIYTIESYVEIGVPAAFLVSVLRRRFARTRIVDLLLRLRGPARAAGVTDALRTVFEDPALEVVGWSTETGTSGKTADPPLPWPGESGGRRELLITSASGEPLAVILADPSLSPHDDLVRAAIAASSFALENAQLEAALRAQLQEVRDSRLRIIQAGITERRRLERDLHDGTQQRLLALKIMLAAAEADTADPQAQAVISRIRSELALVLDELRDLAHGIHPAALNQLGLDQAIKSVAERYTIPIHVSLPPDRFGDAAELTAYYLIAESITNAIKHARASRISVRGEKSSGWLQITITDDGQGGACVSAGAGIRGVIDRVRGIGGDLDLHSPAGHGTQIRAQIPCV